MKYSNELHFEKTLNKGTDILMRVCFALLTHFEFRSFILNIEEVIVSSHFPIKKGWK